MNNKTMAIAIVVVVVIIAAAAVIVITSNGDEDDSTKFVVSFDPNGGTGDMSNLRCDPGSSIVVPECEFNNDVNFRTFTSWNTERDGSGTTYLSQSTIGSDTAGTQTLYAQWELYTMLDLGVGTVMEYEISGGYSYSIFSYQYSGTMTDTLTGVGDVQRTFQRTQTLTVSYTDEYGRDQEQTSTNTTTITEDRDTQYAGSASRVSTPWGVKDAICIERDQTDDYGNTIHIVEYRDAESFIRYSVTMSTDAYYNSGVTLRNYTMTYTLTDYNIVLD